MRTLLGIARTGVWTAYGNPLRSAVTVGCLVAILLPFVAGLGVSRGLRDQAEDSVRFGADLYVGGRRLGRDAPVPTSVAAELRALPGVTEVVPRIVGEIRLGAQAVSAVLVGLPAERLPASTTLVDGRLFDAASPGELVVGSQLAARLHLAVGARIPPFYRNDAGERVSTVVGIFRSGVPIWEANLVFTSLETASTVFAQRGLASSLLVWCRPEALDDVRTAIARMPSLGAPDAFGPLLPRLTSRDDLEAVLSRGLLHREGVFDLHFLLAFALGIPLVLLTTGVGLVERRRETGLLKATGWQTDEILVRSLAESLLLSVAGASIAILLAWVWLGVLGGAGVASVFVSGIDAMPAVDLPFRLTPVPALLCLLLSFVVVVTGSVLSSWRAATASPAEAMR
jgi:ABC-type lipoprotein release transport system permease subunit